MEHTADLERMDKQDQCKVGKFPPPDVQIPSYSLFYFLVAFIKHVRNSNQVSFS